MNALILVFLVFLLVGVLILIGAVDKLKQEVTQMNANFSSLAEAIMGLQTDVANETTVITGAVTLINGIPALIAAAVAAAQAAGATPAQLQAFDDLSTTLESKAQELAAAVASAPSGNVTPGAGVTNPAPVT